MKLTAADAAALERCLRAGGVAVLPTDTVFGLACDPDSPAAVARLYELKGRPPDKPAAVMFFALQHAFAALPELGSRTRAAAEALLPGAVTLVLANPAQRYPLACAADPQALGLRVPALTTALAALAAVGRPLLQSSANRAGEADARTLDGVPRAIRDGADLVLDGGRLPGRPSTVVDLRAYEQDGDWAVLRLGAVPEATVRRSLGEPR